MILERLRQCIGDDLLWDDRTILGVTNGLEPGLECMPRVNTSNMRTFVAMEWSKLNADVLFAVPKRLLNKLDVCPGAVVWRVERDDIRREGL
jgi:hypothetical protein